MKENTVRYGYVRRETRKSKAQRAHLTNSKMVETTDKLDLVRRISRLLYATHCDHLLVHFEDVLVTSTSKGESVLKALKESS